ncbi:phosphatidylserine decarboxylase [Deinococcus wulumuqiensis]|nr:phosphatidylserine decarboxylase [Deinococcus wulumuqiensis]
MRLPRRFPLLAAFAAGVWYLRSVYRFRDPVRLPATQDGGAILSPADGLVSFVRRIEGGRADGLSVAELLGTPQQEGWLLGIFTGPLDVHFTYAPAEGTVLSAGRKPGERAAVPVSDAAQLLAGRAVNLLGSAAVRGNERYSYAVQGEGGQVVTVGLITPGAGLNATTYLDEGQTVRQGNKAAFLAEGGLVLLALPQSVTPQVSVGERVRGAETVVAGQAV